MVDDITHLGLIEETEIELDKAALQIAALDHPGADLPAYLDVLEAIAGRLRSRAARSVGPGAQAARLAEALAGECGFEGDRLTYDDPANADLIRVIDRRRGLPVALAILYVALARRVGWTAHALNTPHHVLVGVGAPPFLVIDPFNRGVRVAPEQLESFLRSALGRMQATPRLVAPMTNRGVLVRLMINQATRAEQAQRLPRALTVFQRITTVAPDYSPGWWDRARLEQATGDVSAARNSLSSMLETTRDPLLRTRVKSALDNLAG